MYRLRMCSIISSLICENQAAALTGHHISFFYLNCSFFASCSRLELIDALLLELWAAILCFSSCGDSTKQSTVTVSNTRMMFCLTRAFQFDTQMITTKQSTLTLGPKNFFSQVRLGSYYQTIKESA